MTVPLPVDAQYGVNTEHQNEDVIVRSIEVLENFTWAGDAEINIMALGATGLVGQDATAIIGGAIDSASTSGKQLRFPAGVYSVTSINKTLIGPLEIVLDIGATIKGVTGLTTPVLQIDGGAGRYALHINGGTIDGSLRTGSAGSNSGTCLYLSNSDGFVVDGVNFYGGADWVNDQADTGFGPVMCQRGSVSNCNFLGFSDVGIYATGGPSTGPSDDYGDITITGCHFYRCAAGVQVKRSMARVIVEGNSFYECAVGVGAGEVPPDLLPGQQVAIIGNTFKFTQARAVDVRITKGNLIIGNIIDDIGYDRSIVAQTAFGIWLNGASESIVSDNVIRMSDWVANAAHSAINAGDLTFNSVLYTAGKNLIADNTIDGVFTGLRESSTTVPNAWLNNHVFNYTTLQTGMLATSMSLVYDAAAATIALRCFFGSTERFRLSSGNVFVNALRFLVTPTEFADDAAAAIGGIPVGGTYKTGSVIKVRVA